MERRKKKMGFFFLHTSEAVHKWLIWKLFLHCCLRPCVLQIEDSEKKGLLTLSKRRSQHPAAASRGHTLGQKSKLYQKKLQVFERCINLAKNSKIVKKYWTFHRGPLRPHIEPKIKNVSENFANFMILKNAH